MTKSKYFETAGFYVYHWPDALRLDIHFSPNQSTIHEKSSDQLDEAARYLERHPNTTIEIIGHTDNTGDKNENLTLSKKRANTVKDYLVKKGIAPDRLQATGKGDSEPVAPNTTEKGRAMNRRTELRVLNE